jgi:hypothetical protein
MRETVENFNLITGYDLESYLNSFVLFIDTDRQSIVDFYQGNAESLPSKSLNELDRLLKETTKIEELFNSNSDSFSTADFCDLVDLIGDIKLKLLTTKKTAKWTRSSFGEGQYNANVEVDVTLNQNQTLEQLARNIGYLDEDNDWLELALKNNLIEEDYTSQGGLKLKAFLQNGLKIKILSIVDVISGENVYGKDIQKKIEFSDNDIKVLGYKDTINQAFEIAVKLKRGDNPEFPNDGLQSSLIVGQNLNSILYNSIFRQIYQTFTKDDTFKDISILDIKQDGETHVSLKIQATTRIDEVISDLILI